MVLFARRQAYPYVKKRTRERRKMRQWSRRGILASAGALAAGMAVGPGWSGPMLQGGTLWPVGAPRAVEGPWALGVSAPWAQVMRTFGNPVLEGHVAVRVAPAAGRVCVAMWDLGDRVLGVGQTRAPAQMLWEIAAAAMGRKPDIAIGRPDILYESDHFEAAHWQLDAATAGRLGRQTELIPQVRQWIVPGRTTARVIEPVLGVLHAPVDVESAYVLWHEPDPAIATRTRLGPAYVMGDSAKMDTALSWMLEQGLMVVPAPQEAQALLERNGGPGLFPVQTPSGQSLGRLRVLRV